MSAQCIDCGLPADAVTTGVAARAVGVSTQTVGRWVRHGRVRGWERAGRYLVSLAEVRAVVVPVAPRADDSPRTAGQARAAAAQAVARMRAEGAL